MRRRGFEHGALGALALAFAPAQLGLRVLKGAQRGERRQKRLRLGGRRIEGVARLFGIGTGEKVALHVVSVDAVAFGLLEACAPPAKRHGAFARGALEEHADHAFGRQSRPSKHFGCLGRLDLVERDGERESLLHGP